MSPHFIIENNLMNGKDINSAMCLVHGPVLDNFKDNAGINYGSITASPSQCNLSFQLVMGYSY